ncbi:MAG: hypothetical protein AB7U83_03265 [Vicinamibacterales bacterium]
MTRTVLVAAAFVAAFATAAQAQTPAPAADATELRHQIYVMEGALARAVNFGAARLNQEIRAVMPDMIVLAGESRARGFQLDDYGVFFDVEVPVLRQSMMWSLRTMLDQDDQGTRDALASLRALVATAEGPERPAAEGALRRLEAQLLPFGAARRVQGGPGIFASGTGAAAPVRPSVPADSVLLSDPNKAYTDSVVRALIDAMIDFSGPLTWLGPDELLTVAARDNEQRDALAPQNPYEEVSTFMLRVKGSDLAAYRAGRINRDEARKRVQVQEF